MRETRRTPLAQSGDSLPAAAQQRRPYGYLINARHRVESALLRQPYFYSMRIMLWGSFSPLLLGYACVYVLVALVIAIYHFGQRDLRNWFSFLGFKRQVTFLTQRKTTRASESKRGRRPNCTLRARLFLASTLPAYNLFRPSVNSILVPQGSVRNASARPNSGLLV
jgi:hypothetical protein